MSGFEILEEDFDRVFMTDQEIIDSFVGERAWSWGANGDGNLGDGTVTTRSSPGTTAGGGVNWSQISISGTAGQRFAAAIKTDGTLWTWGANSNGRLGDGTTTNRSSPGTTAGGGTNWKQVACASTSMGAVKTDGTLWTWGAGTSGVLGYSSAVSRSSPGTTAGGGTNWKNIAAGPIAMAAVKTDGTLWTWGSNASGKLGDGTTTNRSSPGTTAGGGTNWKQAAIGDRTMAAVKTDGTLWTWGSNASGGLGDNSGADRSSPGTTAGGSANWKFVDIGFGLNNDAAMAAIKYDGTLWTWGNDNSGVLGAGATGGSRTSPGTTLGGGTNWKRVSVGDRFMGAVKLDGTLWTWGNGTTGALGDGTVTNRSSPGTTLSNSKGWKSVAASQGSFTMAGIAD